MDGVREKASAHCHEEQMRAETQANSLFRRRPWMSFDVDKPVQANAKTKWSRFSPRDAQRAKEK
jgi:hypothetical protein